MSLAKVYPACWTCGGKVRNPALITVREGSTLDSKEMHPDFKPVTWRYSHRTPECAVADSLSGIMPQTDIEWIRYTVRLLDDRGEFYLFAMSNWRYVLDCVQEGYIEGLNEYENPVKKPKIVAPKKVLRRRRIIKK